MFGPPADRVVGVERARHPSVELPAGLRQAAPKLVLHRLVRFPAVEAPRNTGLVGNRGDRGSGGVRCGDQRGSAGEKAHVGDPMQIGYLRHQCPVSVQQEGGAARLRLRLGRADAPHALREFYLRRYPHLTVRTRLSASMTTFNRSGRKSAVTGSPAR